MLVLAALILLGLTLINYRVSGGQIFYPAVVFCSVWTIELFLIWLVGDFFYPISSATLVILVGGACAFSLGSWLVLLHPQSNQVTQSRPREVIQLSSRIISIGVILILCAIPFAVRWMISQVADHASSSFILTMARTMADDDVKTTLGYTLFGNLVVFANMIAVIAFMERENHKRRAQIAIALAVGLDVAIAARSSLVPLFLWILCVDWLQIRRIRWKPLLASVIFLALAASAIAIYLGKGDANPDATIAENAIPVVQGLVLYSSGGIVAFDQILRNPALQHQDSPATVFMIQILNKLGARIQEPDPSKGPGFIELGPHHLPTNVYTIYFEYLGWGYAGVMATMIILGAGVSLIYRSATAGNPISSILCGFCFSALVLSPFGDLFLGSLNYLWKFYAVLWSVYLFPRVWIFFRRNLSDWVTRAGRDARVAQ